MKCSIRAKVGTTVSSTCVFSIELYIESLRDDSQCHFIGHECDSQEAFEDGLCFDCGSNGEKCAIMGEKAINYKAHVAENGRRHVKLFLNTGKKSPFCRKSPFLFDRQTRLKKLVGFLQSTTL